MDIILCNRKNKISKKFVPEELVEISGNDRFAEVILISKTVYKEYLKMKSAASKHNIYFKIMSGFRTVDYQKLLYKNMCKELGRKEAKKIVAKPGTSEHHTGLAIDILGINGQKVDFENTDEYKWLIKNAYKYGFILRYPKNKEHITGFDYEPWHFRYVGKDIAKAMYNLNYTLEEYVKNID